MQWRFPEEQKEKVLVSAPVPAQTLTAVPLTAEQQALFDGLRAQLDRMGRDAVDLDARMRGRRRP